MIELDDPSWWPKVTVGGLVYAVSPRQIIGLGIGEAAQLAEENGCELPTPELVTAIHEAADCKLPAERLTWKHDGTPATMSSLAVIERQRAKAEAMVTAWEAVHGRANLVSGAAKDVIRTASGNLGIFGWFASNGKPIQPVFTGHGVYWKDASQGLRLCKRVAFAPSVAA